MNNYYHKKIKQNFTDKTFIFSFIIGLIFLAASVFVNYFASYYANIMASSPVTDIILSNIPVYDVSNAFIYGTAIFFFVILFCLLLDPKKMPFALKGIALFFLIRSVFITLTHIAPFPTQIVLDPNSIIGSITFGSDLFFSGHTGLPFLLALIWWKEKAVRIIFLAFSAFFAIIVLLGHLHYSIDVLGALFITYTIFHLLERFFKKDRFIFNGETIII